MCQLQNMTIWWSQIHVPVEFKRKEHGWDETILQLCGYMRQVLREQLDRRFVLGIMINYQDMTVLLNDRSGLVGTATSFNIHKVWPYVAFTRDLLFIIKY
jgi:hypothetical protein